MKQTLKGILNNLFVVPNIPILALYFLLKPISRKDELFASFSQFYSLFPGQFGVYLRRNFYRFTMKRIGKDVYIGFGTLFSHQGIEIGDNVYIGPQCNIGLCSIGAETLIGSGVHILSGKRQHDYKNIDTALRNSGGILQKIAIGKDCWLGNGCIVSANVEYRSVISMGSIVIDNVPKNCIFSSTPKDSAITKELNFS